MGENKALDELLVLYVEDDRSCELLLTAYLEGHNITLDIADSLTAAKQKFDPEKYTAVITDWNLPDGTGLEVAKYIRSKAINFPIIFLSGNHTNEMVEEAKKYALLAFLEKNDMSALAQQISDLLSKPMQKINISEEKVDKLDATIQRVKQRLLHGLKEWLPLFEDFEAQLIAGNIDMDQLESIRDKMHKLSGSVEVFGYKDLSNHVARIERDIIDITNQQPIPEGLKDRFQVFIHKVEEIIATDIKQ